MKIFDREAQLEMLKSEAIASIEGTLTKEKFDERFNELLDLIGKVESEAYPDVKAQLGEDRSFAWLLDLSSEVEGDVLCIQLDKVSFEGRLGAIRVVTKEVEFTILK